MYYSLVFTAPPCGAPDNGFRLNKSRPPICIEVRTYLLVGLITNIRSTTETEQFCFSVHGEVNPYGLEYIPRLSPLL
ncbi:hypothetical protein BMS3Bbin14_01670 [bacterium BMS3Bbin14]|nr:hypothetical protein BMS3Abin13_01745 [bacterium BMS3Abin13]GBE53186.1 hypothetical protein BMS3Bbin14_01670 [bacterium BMS3Bbin14]